MGYINKKNKVGTVAENAAPYLQEGELGVDLNAANGDVGRVYVGTGSQNVALAKKTEINSLNTLLDAINIFRADRHLAAQNIAAMSYDVDGNLSKIQYNNAADVDYEVFAYSSGNLTSIQHYVGSVLKGTTTLSYTSGNLVSIIFVGV